MKYHIKEGGTTVAQFNSPVDAAHGYRLFGTSAYITTSVGRVIYPLRADNNDYDEPSYIAARLLERVGPGARSRSSRADRVVSGQVSIGLREFRERRKNLSSGEEKGWKKQSRNRFAIVTSGSQNRDVKSQEPTQ